MAKIKKIQLGNTTYDLAVDGIDKVDGLEAKLAELVAEHQPHTVDGTTLVIGDDNDQLLESATKLAKIKVNDTLYDIKDTNTWRDVVDNLTSTATDKSLSANQGKVLKDELNQKQAIIEIDDLTAL